jgi:hypothetical protein
VANGFGKIGGSVLRMTDFTKFEFGASFEVLWLKSPTSPSPKPSGCEKTTFFNKLGQKMFFLDGFRRF